MFKASLSSVGSSLFGLVLVGFRLTQTPQVFWVPGGHNLLGMVGSKTRRFQHTAAASHFFFQLRQNFSVCYLSQTRVIFSCENEMPASVPVWLLQHPFLSRLVYTIPFIKLCLARYSSLTSQQLKAGARRFQYHHKLQPSFSTSQNPKIS